MMTSRMALEGIRVLDVTDALGAYSSRLLADLGASVIRIDTQSAMRECATEDPVETNNGQQVSLFDRFVNAGKQRVATDLEAHGGREVITRLAAEVDVLIESSWSGDTLGFSRNEDSRLIHVIVTPFGRRLSPEWGPVDDLIVLGAGGLLYLGGYQDRGPVAAYGGQSRYAASVFAATATLVALIDRERTGRGTTIDVSAQECVAQALEDSVPTFALTGQERMRYGTVAREAGTGMYACADGYVAMVAGRLGTARAWAALVEWLDEEREDGAETIASPRWSEFSYRQSEEAIEIFTQVFEGFAASRSKLDLYVEAQRRGIALSPVNGIADLIADPQLREREFFVSMSDDEFGSDLRFPGNPYRLSITPPRVGAISPPPGEDGHDFFEDRGVDSEPSFDSLMLREAAK